MRLFLLAFALLAVLPLAACDSSTPEIVPAGLEGTWNNVNGQETITYLTTSNGYRFQRIVEDGIGIGGSFATAYDATNPSSLLRIRYTVDTGGTMLDDVAQLDGDRLELRANVADAPTRVYARAN